MHKEKKSRLSFRSDELAVPEVHTGAVPAAEDLPEDEAEIRYDTLAVPEIHPGGKKRRS